MQILNGAKVPIKVWVDDLAEVESQALDQLRNTANLPWVEGVAAMPDVHYGFGATVGSVIVSRGAVSPAVVGVDIGCGMQAALLNIPPHKLDRLHLLRHSLERSVPVGFAANKEVSDRVVLALEELGPQSPLGSQYVDKAAHQLGTLGGGNHFIELCLDDKDRVWVMLHSGSRHIGKSLAEKHINVAKGLLREYADEGMAGHGIPEELAALVVDTDEYKAYITDLLWCQRYAAANRREMMLRVLKDLSYHVYGELRAPGTLVVLQVECHHNYIEVQLDGSLLTRKGAVSAKQGELGIIPGSMGTRSYIVRGRGNSDSYCSCSHGAGRRMSRGQAKRSFTVADMAAQTQGVECRKDDGVLDEIPGAYKAIETVMRQQADLVDVLAVLKQVLCVKG